MKSISTEDSTQAGELEHIVGAAGICQQDELEAEQRSQLERAIAPGTAIEAIVSPNTQAELAAVMACASRHRLRVLPMGSGSKLHWGGLVQGAHLAVRCDRLNRLIEHAVGDLTVTVEAGMKFADLQQTLGKVGQFLALDPAYPEVATIGGILATADAGSLRHRYRGVRDRVLGISFARSDGQIAKAGGRVVKNVAGYDLMKLLTGSYGTLGAIAQVTLRVFPLPEASGTAILTGEADALEKATQTLVSSALTPVAVDLFSTTLAEAVGLGKRMGLAVRFQSIEESVKQQCDRTLELGEKLGLQGLRYWDSDEIELWQRLKQQIWHVTQDPAIICKIGVRPSEAMSLLQELPLQNTLIQAGIGVGLVRFNAVTPERLLQVRRQCELKGGFLSILEAPVSFKQQIDIWGYNGTALTLMRQIKKQFDPQNLLSPNRFVGGI